MMSLEFFPPAPRRTGEEYPEWGTGRLKKESQALLGISKAPNWICTGEPVKQYYDLTELQKSHVRPNDQLLPNPQHSEMHTLIGENPFPADHPFSSHISKFAVFPKFDSPEDPKRGVEARRHVTKNHEMPAGPQAVTVISKIKGSGARHEMVNLSNPSYIKPLEWHEHDFHQIPKSAFSSNKQTYYPTPPKRYVPNLQDRRQLETKQGDMVVSARTANAMRNVERAQWKTTYDLNHTGFGSSNPLDLDNFDQKMEKKRRGIDDDNLYSRSAPVFDPARPMDGRVGRRSTPAPPGQSDKWPDGIYDTTYQRKPTLSEKEENRLVNGGGYVNLPEGTNPYLEEKKRLQQEQEKRRETKSLEEDEEDDLPVEPARQVFADSGHEELVRQFQESHQQMEARNRWKLLESQKPGHDIVALHNKMDEVSVKTHPRVFYDHEARYQRERAGVYKTSYDPYKLQYEMNRDEKRGSSIMDVSASHVDALNVPTTLNRDMAEIRGFSRNLWGSPATVAQMHDWPSPYEAIGPFKAARKLQTERLQPDVQTSDVRTQEGVLLATDSLYGVSYNTKKFLQEQQMPFHARNEPLDLMSGENQSLKAVRLTTIPRSDRWSSRVDDVLHPDPLSVPATPRAAPDTAITRLRPQTAPEVGAPMLSSTRLERSVTDQAASRSSNFAGEDSWESTAAQQSQFPETLDARSKNGYRFEWRPGCGTRRPQSRLLDMQNSFSKTEARRKFLEQFAECGVDLRENITRGKKHTFGGMNSQVLRGAAVA